MIGDHWPQNEFIVMLVPNHTILGAEHVITEICIQHVTFGEDKKG